MKLTFTLVNVTCYQDRIIIAKAPQIVKNAKVKLYALYEKIFTDKLNRILNKKTKIS